MLWIGTAIEDARDRILMSSRSKDRFLESPRIEREWLMPVSAERLRNIRVRVRVEVSVRVRVRVMIRVSYD